MTKIFRHSVHYLAFLVGPLGLLKPVLTWLFSDLEAKFEANSSLKKISLTSDGSDVSTLREKTFPLVKYEAAARYVVVAEAE